MLKNIIVLSSTHIANQVVDILNSTNSTLNYDIAENLEDLEKYNNEFLAESRLISFISTVIVPKKILDALGYDGINFHPGPPTHPGWAPFNFAIYDEDESYGITAHYMIEKVDAGKIIGIDFFEINKNIKVSELVNKSLEGLTRLLKKLALQLTNDKKIIALPISWGQNKTSKRMFEHYCEIGKEITRKELAKRIRAFGGDIKLPLYINASDGKYIVDSSRTITVNSKYKTIHGLRFKKQ